MESRYRISGGQVRGVAHEGVVKSSGGEEADEPGVVVEPTDGREDEAHEGDGNPGSEREQGFGIEAAGVFVDAAPAIKIGEAETAAAQEEIIADHDAGDGAEQSRVADEPAEDVGTVRGHELPGHHEDADKAGDEA